MNPNLIEEDLVEKNLTDRRINVRIKISTT